MHHHFRRETTTTTSACVPSTYLTRQPKGGCTRAGLRFVPQSSKMVWPKDAADPRNRTRDRNFCCSNVPRLGSIFCFGGGGCCLELVVVGMVVDSRLSIGFVASVLLVLISVLSCSFDGEGMVLCGGLFVVVDVVFLASLSIASNDWSSTLDSFSIELIITG